MSLTEITDQDFQEKVLQSSLPVLVDFWAPWCGPCRLAAPALEELSEQYNNQVLFVKLNVDEHQQYAGQFGVMSIPTTILFKNGEEISRQIGFAGKNSFEELVTKAL